MSTTPSPTIQMYAPDGTLGDIPYERMHDALGAGGKMAVHMTAPDGTEGYIPADQVSNATKAGGKIIPFNVAGPEQPKEGFWSAAGNTLSGLLHPQALNPYPGLGQQQKMEAAEQAHAADVQRKGEGRSLGYRAIAPLAQTVGADVGGMEQAARSGDTSGVFGHAAGSITPVAVGAGIGIAADRFGANRPATAGNSPIAERLYQSALKPPPGTYSTPEVASMVKSGLDYEIPVSSGGVDKLHSLVRDLNDKVQAQIDSGHGTVNKFSIASRLADTANKFETQVNPEADLNAVGASGNEFLRNQPNEIPVSQAQKLKVGTYQQLGNKAYGELSSATIESQKALARGIKEELEVQFPEIKGFNKQESQLYDLQPALERAVRRIDNHDIISLGSKVTAGAGAALAGAPGAVAGGILEKALGMPLVKSKLAIAINAASKGKIPIGMAEARVAAYAAQLANANAQNQEQSAP